MTSERTPGVGAVAPGSDTPASRYLPVVSGMFAFALVWALWGSLAHPAFSNDESAYLLQARIFASGRLVGAARPLPEFFQQYHVFVTPVLAAHGAWRVGGPFRARAGPSRRRDCRGAVQHSASLYERSDRSPWGFSRDN